MQVNHIFPFDNQMKIKIQGKNIERFLRRLIQNKIDLLDIKYTKNNEVIVKIYAKDYEKIEEIKTIYAINVVDTYGFIKIKKMINYYKLLLIMMCLGFITLLFLVNVITEVEVIHTDSDLRKLILEELDDQGISKFHLKKNYEQLEKIKNQILTKHKNEIEWLEIESVGTKYQVRVEERKIMKTEESDKKVNIIAKKSAIIKQIEAQNGVIVKEKESYVNKGDVVISGEIYLNEELKNIVSAKGKVYGEVWYKSTIEFPYLYYEENYTGKKKTVYSIKFLNWSFDLFNFHPFNKSKKSEKVIFNHFLLPFRFVKEEQEEVVVKDQIYTMEEAIVEARKLGTKKMKEKLREKEYIIDTKDLNVSTKKSKIKLDMFFTVYEDITDTMIIDEEQLKKKQEEKQTE